MMGPAPMPIGRALSLGRRADQVERLRTELFDLVIVGGGITGAGIALDAATRGLRVALVEKYDFASGTSSRTTKLIHGGLRYLAQRWFRLTREALAERSVLQQLAPHLVEPIPFVYPIYNKRFEVWRVNTGLWLYDLMAGLRRTKVHRRLSRDETLRRVPGLKAEGLRASFVYYDARTDDSRLVVEVLKAAVSYGAVVANYVAAETIAEDEFGLRGITARDLVSGEVFPVRGFKVVLATGIWLNELLSAGGWNQPRVRPAKGVHLVVPRERLGSDMAVVFPTPDNRLMFVVPWQGQTLVGTTDTDYAGPLDAPRADDGDVSYILAVVNAAFPGLNLTPSDIISVMAGLRPLVDTGESTTANVSREDRVFEAPNGVVAIAGGKLTTYRRMGRKVVDLVVNRLRDEGRLRKKARSRTADVLIGGYPERPRRRVGRLLRIPRLPRFARRRPATLPIAPPSLTPETGRRLWRTYGANWQAIVDLVGENPSLGTPVIPGLDILRAELVFAVRHEMAQTLLDILARRTHLAALDRNQARDVAAEVARLVGPELGWSEAEQKRQVEQFNRDVEQFSLRPVPSRSATAVQS
jgi:glycerol-3-phosphate dehydrogenase